MHSTIGLVGVGRMGGALLPHLLSVAPVVAHDADPARAEAVRTAGARWTDDVAEVFRSATTLVTVLPGPRELKSVMASAAFRRPGALWIDMTSGDPRVSDRLAASVEALGGQAVGAPIAGSPLDAERRSLTFFVGGPPSAKAAAAPLLEHLSTGGTVRDAGPRAGDAQTAKLVANALWFAIVVATSEALLLGRSLGIEPPALAALLRDSAGGSVFADRHLGPMLDGDPFATFGIDRVVEELDTVAALGTDTGTPMPVLGASAAVHRAALARYGPELGELLAVRWLEDEAGRRLQG
jgi:3-hydroxyisobutyrate dehydrogenase-like beta-hydroxyacid dehydrogenase